MKILCPSGHAHELTPGFVWSWIRVLVSLKTYRVEEFIHVESVVAPSPRVGDVGYFGQWSARSGITLIT
ncbi:hypothetical protein TNCV_791261 [Trichonephila clavipes]|nr:hypothetical protein TNCV_791261 [Trichonephila clavipes]